MKMPANPLPGIGRRGSSALAAVITMIVVVAASKTSILAQDEPTKGPGTAIQPAQTRLPEDQPKAASSPSAAATSPSSAGATASTTSAQPGAPDMQQMMTQMMELSKLNENHKLLTDLAGTWNYTVRLWMDGNSNSKPQESKGTAVRKAMMGGRYCTLEVGGKMQMPGPDGKMKEMEFKGMGLEGYDNVKKKFVGTWMDNMGTGIMMSEGAYDPATKTFTYASEIEAIPGMKQKIREVVKVTDKDHHVFEWYEDRGGHEVKTMEIAYSRASKK